MNPYTLLVVIYAAVFLSSPLIAVFHEFGHALAYLIFTKPENIDIFIGSYGDEKNALQFRIYKLNFFIKKSFPFVKGIGLCHSSKPESDYRKFIVILLAGPVFTLIAAAIIAIAAFTSHVHLLILIFCYIFLGFSLLSMIANLVPRSLNTTSGNSLNSDGMQIIYTLKLKDNLPDYNSALMLFKNKEYQQSIVHLSNVLEKKPGDIRILRLLVAASGMLKKYDDVELYLQQIEAKEELSVHDLIQKGNLQSLTRRHDEAIATYQQVLKKDKHNAIALINVAEELIDKGAFEIAQRALDKVTKYKPDFPYLQSTIAYSKLMQGDFEEGKIVLDKCIALNTANAYTYKSLGIYYIKLKDVTSAADNFRKAKELDESIDFGYYEDELRQLSEVAVNNSY